MAKIGRNDPCFCGSGIKYKKCCLGKEQKAQPATPPQEGQQVSLNNEVEKLQQAAIDKRNTFNTIGVFIFFSTDAGDGWLLEISAMDAVQVAAGGEKIEVEIVEAPETIEINWSHRFTIRKKKFVTIAYADKTEQTHDDYPGNRILTTVKKIRKQFPPEMLEQVHVTDDLVEE